MRRRGGTPMMVIGVVLFAASVIGVAYEIGQAIGQAGAIKDDAVARGVVRDGAGDEIAFETPRHKLTVYLDFHGVSSNSDVYDDTSSVTGCEVTGQDGSTITFSGSRQGTAATIGSYVSVGSFELDVPSGRIRCGYDRARNLVNRPDSVPFLLTPHSTGEVAGPVLLIIAFVVTAILGGVLFFLGRSRRRAVTRFP